MPSADAAGTTELILRLTGAQPERRTFEPVNALRANLKAFADAVEGRAAYLIPVAQMIDVIGGLEAIVASIESGNVVNVAT